MLMTPIENGYDDFTVAWHIIVHRLILHKFTTTTPATINITNFADNNKDDNIWHDKNENDDTDDY